MTVAIEDYDRAIEDFLIGIRDLGDDLKGVLLYGSVVGDRFVPGKSDLLDAYIFVSQRILENPSRYRRLIETIVEQCDVLSSTDLPFRHPPHYHGDEETAYLPGEYLPEMLSDEYSRILWGENLRSFFPNVEKGIATGVIEEARQFVYLHFAKYLAKDDLTPEERDSLAKAMHVWFRKFTLTWACSTMRVPTPAPVALDKIKQLFPEIDFAAIEEITDVAKRTRDLPETGELKKLLRECLTVCEELYELISRSLDRKTKRPPDSDTKL